MTTIAYIANEFPSPLEPYVIDEITELRRRGAQVICCSGKRVSPNHLSLAERAFWKETHFFQPLSDRELVRAARRLASDRHNLWQLLRPLLWERGTSPARRIRALGHTLMGAALAEQLAPLEVEHIHAHHGYFASWMALAAARLLGIGFSFTLHGSDLLQRADLLSAKLRACQFCVTVSDFNRQYILRSYPATPAEKIIVQRLGVDRVLPWPTPTPASEAEVEAEQRRLCLLSVGRLHRVKDYRFLIQACAALRDQALDFHLLDRRRGAGTPGSRKPDCGPGTPRACLPDRPRASHRTSRLLPLRRLGRHDQQERRNPGSPNGGHGSRKTCACSCHHRDSRTGRAPAHGISLPAWLFARFRQRRQLDSGPQSFSGTHPARGRGQRRRFL